MFVSELASELDGFQRSSTVWVQLPDGSYTRISGVIWMGDEIRTPGLQEDDCIIVLEKQEKDMAGKMTAASPDMMKFGLSVPGLTDLVQHFANLLVSDGARVASLARDGLAVLAGISGHDLTAIFAAIGQGSADFKQLRDDILKEFGI